MLIPEDTELPPDYIQEWRIGTESVMHLKLHFHISF